MRDEGEPVVADAAGLARRGFEIVIDEVEPFDFFIEKK